MRYHTLGRNGPLLSVVGFGAWAIGGPWAWGWGRQDDRQSIAALHRALDAGVNWIDTAPAYGLGHSELLVGRVLRQRADRDRIVVATKCGLWPTPARSAASASLTSTWRCWSAASGSAMSTRCSRRCR